MRSPAPSESGSGKPPSGGNAGARGVRGPDPRRIFPLKGGRKTKRLSPEGRAFLFSPSQL
jgi:hypothetical protein